MLTIARMWHMENAITPTLSDVLSELMFERKIKMIELAHLTGVPQSTLSRILSGETTHPHRSSLEPLAAFFQVTVNQLIGKDPIASLLRLAPKLPSVPLLTWAQVTPWLTPAATFVTDQSIAIDIDVAERSFAVTVEDAAMEPQFPQGTVLIVDTGRPAKDRSFVIARLGDSHKVIFRQLLTDGVHQYLRSLSPDFNQFGMITLTSNDTILGVVLQARKNYLE